MKTTPARYECFGPEWTGTLRTRSQEPKLRPLKGTTEYHLDYKRADLPKHVWDLLTPVRAEVDRVIGVLNGYYAGRLDLTRIERHGGVSEPLYTYHRDENRADEPARRYRLWQAYRVVGDLPIESHEVANFAVPEDALVFLIDLTVRTADRGLDTVANQPHFDLSVATPYRSDREHKSRRIAYGFHLNPTVLASELVACTEAIDDLLAHAERRNRIAALLGEAP